MNIHGALNLETFDLAFVAPTTVDGLSTVQLLAKIEVRNPYKRLIHVIWNNAAYNKPNFDTSERDLSGRRRAALENSKG